MLETCACARVRACALPQGLWGRAEARPLAQPTQALEKLFKNQG